MTLFFTQRSASSSDLNEDGDLADERNENHNSYGQDDEQENDYTLARKKNESL